MNTVNKPFRKKDAMQLVTGQPVYMDDLVPADCLIVKLLRSPHANAIVKSINTAVAKKVPGIEAIFTWEDVPQDARRYTQAGQTYTMLFPPEIYVSFSCFYYNGRILCCDRLYFHIKNTIQWFIKTVSLCAKNQFCSITILLSV